METWKRCAAVFLTGLAGRKKNGDVMMIEETFHDLPSGNLTYMTYIAIENGHRNSELSH